LAGDQSSATWNPEKHKYFSKHFEMENGAGTWFEFQLLRQKVSWLKPSFSGFEVFTPVPFRLQKISRNAPCPCGSGRKFKKCCGAAQAED
jgi:uncharacterized protein YecA (UPF0149 family)